MRHTFDPYQDEASRSFSERLKSFLQRPWERLVKRFVRFWANRLVQGGVVLAFVAVIFLAAYVFVWRSPAPLPEIKALPLPLRLKPVPEKDARSSFHVYRQMKEGPKEESALRVRSLSGDPKVSMAKKESKRSAQASQQSP